jgi:hypothetical protein
MLTIPATLRSILLNALSIDHPGSGALHRRQRQHQEALGDVVRLSCARRGGSNPGDYPVTYPALIPDARNPEDSSHISASGGRAGGTGGLDSTPWDQGRALVVASFPLKLDRLLSRGRCKRKATIAGSRPHRSTGVYA